MSINPKMWDDKHFVPFSDQAKLLWCHLLTGYSGGVPGLIQGGVGHYAEAMRWDIDKAGLAIRELSQAKFIEYDSAARLLRVPGRPKYAPCTNNNVVKGWLRRWRDLPDSPLKYRHVESVRDAICDRKWFHSSWDETFGQIKIPESSRQVPLFHYEPVVQNQTLTGNSNDNREMETNEKQLPAHVPTLNITAPSTVTVTETSTSTSTATSSGLDAFRALADEIWQEQEDICSKLRDEGCHGRALGLVNPAKLELLSRISERSAAGTTESASADCRHVLAVLVAEAREKKTTKWIDGAHWESRRFNMSLARDPGDSAGTEPDVRYGRVEPMDFEDYPKPGENKDWR